MSLENITKNLEPVFNDIELDESLFLPENIEKMQEEARFYVRDLTSLQKTLVEELNNLEGIDKERGQGLLETIVSYVDLLKNHFGIIENEQDFINLIEFKKIVSENGEGIVMGFYPNVRMEDLENIKIDIIRFEYEGHRFKIEKSRIEEMAKTGQMVPFAFNIGKRELTREELERQMIEEAGRLLDED